jgi:hypothetical protein
MTRRTFERLFCTGALLFCCGPIAVAGGLGRCAHCGCHTDCCKVCRLVEEEKKVEVVCYGAKCEDFCIAGPSKRGCQHCETVCDFCDQPDPKGPDYVKPKAFVWTDWMPGCAEVFTKKKLMKKTITKKVPSYKWVVEDLCPKCERNSTGASVPAGTPLPKPPVEGARVKYEVEG